MDNYISFILIFSFSLLITQKGAAQTQSLTKGEEAPTFSAKGSLGGDEFDFSLKDALADGPAVVYFFPSAYTKGCDLEASTFADYKEDFEDADATIIGVSADNLERLNEFSADPDFCAGKFPIVSDPNGKIAATYGLKISYPDSQVTDVNGAEINHGFLPRTTFVVNADGEIVKVFSSDADNISPDEHVKKSLSIVEDL